MHEIKVLTARRLFLVDLLTCPPMTLRDKTKSCSVAEDSATATGAALLLSTSCDWTMMQFNSVWRFTCGVSTQLQQLYKVRKVKLTMLHMNAVHFLLFLTH
jgi:hypothetical protein